jgi:hypothetical protein
MFGVGMNWFIAVARGTSSDLAHFHVLPGVTINVNRDGPWASRGPRVKEAIKRVVTQAERKRKAHKAALSACEVESAAHA